MKRYLAILLLTASTALGQNVFVTNSATKAVNVILRDTNGNYVADINDLEEKGNNMRARAPFQHRKYDLDELMQVQSGNNVFITNSATKAVNVILRDPAGAYVNAAGGGGGGDAIIANGLVQFAPQTSANLKATISDENAPDGASSKLIMALGSLSIASGKTATFSNTITFAGTDSTVMTFPSTTATIARTDAANTFTGIQTFSASLAVTGAAGAGFAELKAQSAVPSTPSAGLMRLYAATVAGREFPRTLGATGVNVALQSALWDRNIEWIVPSGATTIPTIIGAKLTSGGTVTHPTPTSTSVATQLHRTMFADIVTTTNQNLGVFGAGNYDNQFWRGNAAGLGGFFFKARITIETWPATTVRVFVGLSGIATAENAADTLTGDCIGLSHITTDPASGSGAWNIRSRDNTTTATIPMTPGTTLAAGTAWDVYLFAKPNDTVIYYRVDDVNAGTTLVDSSTSTNIPRNTQFMNTQVGGSNGTANIVANDTAFGIVSVYVEN